MDVLYYQSSEHKRNVEQLIEKYNRKDQQPSSITKEYQAAFYLLGIEPLAFNKGFPCIDGYGIDFLSIKRLQLPKNERVLLELANHLFNGDGNIKINDLVDSLDDEHYKLAMEAMRIKRGTVK